MSTEPGPHQRTTIVDAATGATVGKRPGTPSPHRLWDQTGDPIVAADGDFVAALSNSGDCDGVLVYNPGHPDAACLEGAVAPVFSPDNSLVAFTRETGRTGPTSGPHLESYDGLPIWEVAIFDRTDSDITVVADVTVVAEAAVGYYFPDLTWNEDGSKLLIRWPNVFGL